MSRPAQTVAIAGAGLAGRMFAWALSRAGHPVQVFDAGPGPAPRFDGHGAAAFTAAGMLSPLAELEKAEADVAALGWQSLRLWPLITAQLPQTVRLETQGSLLVAHRQDLGSAQRILARLNAAPQPDSPAAAQALSSAELQALEPALQHTGLHSWLLPGEGLIHPPQAMAALHAGASLGDVQWHWQQPVTHTGARRLQLADGRCIDADWVIDTRGLGARPQLPLRGVRGEVVQLQLPGHALRRPVRLLHPRYRVYLVPRSESELMLGASEIESEDRSEVSLQSAVELMAAAHSVMPSLSEARILRLDRNLRPALPDNKPQAHCAPGLLQLNGLYRHGWLLAPALVQALLSQSGLGSLA
ncbi:FAD-dependent oxidoreductase [Roseateles koreensis]|uniref:FAD-dependent oxidoreductase n=1 Tax=Roseateles koreensis TaxID=2987526 RepID=A0ABT5KR59_9BURK|nr:FAD-dependent oxidoreductase [Roseateles koreensis]MDC8785326.1 FAD-dependent oxidoreductase [Roseateles koreensis]